MASCVPRAANSSLQTVNLAGKAEQKKGILDSTAIPLPGRRSSNDDFVRAW